MSTHTLFPHYFVTALRNLARHKLYSFINIAGLSVGLACAIFIILFVRHELSYDRWIPDSSTLYRVGVTVHLPGRAAMQSAQVPFPLLRAMQEISEVKSTTHVVPERMTATVGDRQFSETVAVVDPAFFQVIKLPLVEGDPARVLAQPESIVLSQSMARKFFGAADPLGKIVTVSAAEGWGCDAQDTTCLSAVHPLTVTGVLRDLPHNTQLAADLILPNSSQADELRPAFRENAWLSGGTYGYVALTPGADPRTVLAKLTPIVDRSVDPKRIGANLRGSEFMRFHLAPFWNVHLTSDNDGGMKPPGSWNTVYGLSIIALLIVLVACFNFMNLATARATLRAREISLRKVVGAKRRQLIVQFLGEALLTALVSLAVALALVEMLLPIYDGFLNQPIEFHYLADWPLLLTLVAGAIAAGLLSGAYPAFVLSAFRPAAVLKMSASTQTGSGLMRMLLVVSQFAVSIGLGIAALVVFSQINFARHIDLGFERDGVVIIRGITKLAPSARESFARALSAHPQIAGAVLSDAAPFDLSNVSNVAIQIQGEPQSFAAHLVSISPDFPSLYGMQLVAGRFLSTAHGDDVSGHTVLINTEAMRRFGHAAEETLGKTMAFANGRATIVGIVGDAKIDGTNPVQPTVYVDEPEDYTLLSVRLRGGQIAEALSYIDTTWRSFMPGAAIQRHFLNDSFEELFASDEKQGAMLGLFASIAVFIACLGLFGVAAFTAERRTKEIGLRKVFGAHTRDIVRLLLWQFSIPVLIANVIAWPVAYYYLHHWLESYAYRITLNPLYFLAAGLIALTIAWVTIIAHALRIARASPIIALRYE
jgi:putative ABC transport system permease protein